MPKQFNEKSIIFSTNGAGIIRKSYGKKGARGGREGGREGTKEGRELQSVPYQFLKPYTKIPIFSNNIHVVSSKPYIKLLNLYKKT